MAGKRDIEAGRAFVRIFLKDNLSPQIRSSLATAGKVVKTFAQGATLALGSVTAAVTASVTEFARAGAELKKLSKQTGASVRDLSILQFAARQSGVDVDDLHGAIEELNNRLGEATLDGTGPLGEAFRKLGIDANEFVKLDVAKQIERLAMGIKDLPRQDRAFITDEILGGDAFKLLPMLQDISEGLDEAAAKAERFGLVMTDEAADGAASLMKSLNDVALALQGASRKFAEGFLSDDNGSAADNVESLAESIAAIDWQLFGQTARDAFKIVGIAAKSVLGIVNELVTVFHGAQEGAISFLEFMVDNLAFPMTDEERENKNIILDSLANSKKELARKNQASEVRAQELLNNMDMLIDGIINPKPTSSPSAAPSKPKQTLADRLIQGQLAAAAKAKAQQDAERQLVGAAQQSVTKADFESELAGGISGGELASGPGEMIGTDKDDKKPFLTTPDLVTFNAAAAAASGFMGSDSEAKQQTREISQARQSLQRIEDKLERVKEGLKH